jgi:hypothetical protein
MNLFLPCLKVSNMKIIFSFILFALTMPVMAQQFSIYINDNRGNQNIAYEYRMTEDSLVITGISDYGKTKVNYMSRRYTKEEYRSLKNFFKTFSLDSLRNQYFAPYSNFEYISADHFPRVIELLLHVNGKERRVKTTNAYVNYLTPFFERINTLLPEEVKIRLKKEDFPKVY